MALWSSATMAQAHRGTCHQLCCWLWPTKVITLLGDTSVVIYVTAKFPSELDQEALYKVYVLQLLRLGHSLGRPGVGFR